MIIQSSSILTSTLTPLVGVGLLSLERMLPLTIGANIGTTLTGILAALAVPASKIHLTLQVALSHLFFNITGALLFYPIPIFRRVPIKLSKILGNVTASYRWFSIVYLVLVFFAIPAVVFALSIAGDEVIMAVGIPVLVILVAITSVNITQNTCPRILPTRMRTWNFLPLWMHSLEPCDRVLSCCCKKAPAKNMKDVTTKVESHENKAFEAHV